MADVYGLFSMSFRNLFRLYTCGNMIYIYEYKKKLNNN